MTATLCAEKARSIGKGGGLHIGRLIASKDRTSSSFEVGQPRRYHPFCDTLSDSHRRAAIPPSSARALKPPLASAANQPEWMKPTAACATSTRRLGAAQRMGYESGGARKISARQKMTAQKHRRLSQHCSKQRISDRLKYKPLERCVNVPCGARGPGGPPSRGTEHVLVPGIFGGPPMSSV